MNLALLPRLLFISVLCLLPAARADSSGSIGTGAPVENRQPTLELNYMICVSGPHPYTDGIVRSYGGSPYPGEIRLFAGNFTPGNWLPCDGRLLPILGNQILFSYIGTTFGGNGSENFALPDLRGRVPVGTSDALPLGTVIGAAAPSLTLAQMPAHTHSLAGGATTGSTGGTTPFDNRQPGLALHHLLVASSSDFNFVGEIVLFAGPPPTQNLPCDGRPLPIGANSALFAKLGTTFGGDGLSTFALPDLRGRAAIGAGQAPGGSAYALGQASGSETVTLGVAQLPAHSHAISEGATGATGQGAAVDNRQPTLALNYQIVAYGIFPSPGSNLRTDLYVTDVRLTSAVGNFDASLLPADGRLVSIDEYDTLVVVLGTSFGGTAFVNAFLPDTRGRLVAGAPTPTSPGATYGVESYTLTAARLPAHTHDIYGARELWRIEYFGTAENTGDAADSATPRGDGVPNLLKFATGLDPTLPATQPGEITRNGANLEFVYPRAVDALGELTFVVEWSDTLAAGSWSTSGVSEQVLGTVDGVESVKVTLPVGPAGRRFVRLRVVP